MNNRIRISYSTLLLLLIFFSAFFLRFYHLDQIPNGLNKDETAIGYNAYSILKTGRDEYGVKMPLYFKSFNDYKLPVYIYTTVASIKLFGMTPFAIRFFSAISGFFTVLFLYFFLKDLSKRTAIAITASALLAINPWHIFFSRAAFEVNVAFMFTLLGVWMLIKSMQSQKIIYLFLSIITFGIAMYTYNVTRVTSPLLFVLLLLFYRKDIMRFNKKALVAALSFAIVTILPLILTLFSQSGINNQQDLLLIGHVFRVTNLNFRSNLSPLPLPIIKLFFNNWTLIIWQYFTNYVRFFSVDFFFVHGADNLIDGIGNVGMFYIFEAITIPYGFFIMLKSKEKYWQPIYIWFAVVLIVGCLIIDVPQPTRNYLVLLPFTIFSAVGIVHLWLKIRTIKMTFIKNITTIISCLIVFYAVIYFLASYLYQFPITGAQSWRSPDPEVVTYIMQHQKTYNKIIFDTSTDFSYTSLLFYSGYDPATYQKQAIYRKDGALVTLAKAGKFEYQTIDETTNLEKNTLYITNRKQLPLDAGIIKTFYYPMRNVVSLDGQNIITYPYNEPAYILIERQ